MALNKSMKYHQYVYLTKLFDNMEKLPAKPEVKHDEFFGKIKIISKGDQPKTIEDIKMEENNKNNDIIIIDDNSTIEIKCDVPKIEVDNKPEKKEDEIPVEKIDIKPPKILKNKGKRLINKINRIKNNMNNMNLNNINIEENNNNIVNQEVIQPIKNDEKNDIKIDEIKVDEIK